MKVVTSCKLDYTIFPEEETVKALIEVGKRHYDSHCRYEATEGCLKRWAMQLDKDYWLRLDGYVTATWRELDTIAKILEMLPGESMSWITDEQRIKLIGFKFSVMRILHDSHRIAEEVTPIFDKCQEY